jgi:lipopolysaccharide export LptBFGC system permease protein LptF
MSSRYRRILALFLLILLTSGEHTMALEQTKYAIIEKNGDFELRQYEPHIVAETLVEGDFNDVGDEGFRRLAGYIFGKNRKKEKISMTSPEKLETAPVSLEAAPVSLESSEKIAMTAPVTQESKNGIWRITFLMPSEYTLETLPHPLNSSVTLQEVPGALMAALTYSGTWSQERYEKKKARLETLLQQRGLHPVGAPVFARYNPPFTPWFLRRNEVLIPVEPVNSP